MSFTRLRMATLVLGVLCSLAGLKAQQPPPPDSDNTRTNQRDRAKAEPTADQAKNTAVDRELMQKIRRSLMDDKSLSTYAHNIKIVAQNGKVTLKGPVRSDEEERVIVQKATEVAGSKNITNEITIKPEKKKD